jgi:hypothetical protein
MEQLPCGRIECVFKAVKKTVQKMKEEIAKTQNIQYPEQIVVAKIYDIVASQLAKACRENFKIKKENCVDSNPNKHHPISIDTFLLLKQLNDDKLITEEYKNTLFDTLLKIDPSLKGRVEKDRESGFL